jgi:signal transduction histidine kinase
MKTGHIKFSLRYETALQAYLKQSGQANLKSARGLGAQALSSGLRTLDMTQFHEQVLINKLLPGCPPLKRAALIRRSGVFFAAAILPVEEMFRSIPNTTARLKKFIEALSQRTVQLAASNLELNLEIKQRKIAEEALKKSERHYSQQLDQSERLQMQLKHLSRQILSVQEEERKEISRELHDVIAQTLTGINNRLDALKKQASINIKGLDLNIVQTQLLVEKSVKIVHKFARELRPALLDDLGLIPALHSFLKQITTRTGIRTHLTAFAALEQLDAKRRTVLYRIAQEALTNVTRHAQATEVHVSIRKFQNGLRMEVKDDGKSFKVEHFHTTTKNNHLGLIGMRERVEMVGGTFSIESVPGNGTTVRVDVPFNQNKKKASKIIRRLKKKPS